VLKKYQENFMGRCERKSFGGKRVGFFYRRFFRMNYWRKSRIWDFEKPMWGAGDK